MILKIDRQQRNYNFLEIVRGYNLALKQSKGKNYVEDIYELGFNLIGMDSADKLFDALVPSLENIDSNKTSLDLFYKANGKYYFSNDKEIKPVSTVEEAGIIYSMLKRGDFDLYLDSDEKALLEQNINKFFNNMGEEPVDLYSFIEVKGRSVSADDLSKIKDTFSILNKAIKYKRQVRITYNKIYEQTFDIQPIKFVFSQLDEKMRVKAFSADGICRTYYLDYINKIELLDNNSFKPYSPSKPNIKKLKFSFENGYNLPERVAARFSDYQKEIHFNKKDNTITYIVDYEDNPTENRRILNRLSSLGKRVNIMTEEKQIIKSEAQKALANYKKN